MKPSPMAVIDKFAALQASEDYAALRRQGFEHIETLASELWTDYNVHDPGITTLEMLCYAITDLGYRTSYPIEDILAEETVVQSPNDARHFFTAREILPCNPVTQKDFRKIMLDVPGIKNAWLEMVTAVTPQLYVDCAASRLTLRPRFKITAATISELQSQKIPSAVLTQMETLQDQEFADATAFLSAQAGAIGSEAARQYQFQILGSSAIMGTGLKGEPVYLQGLYEVILELETDDEQGDLNRYIFPIDVSAGEDAWVAAVILPAWDIYMSQGLDPGGLQQLVFGPLSYNVQRTVYEGQLQVVLQDQGTLETDYRVVFRGPKTEANRRQIEDTLKNDITLPQTYRAKLLRALAISGEVFEKLHAHRNLAEDFHDFKALAVDDVVLCADLEVSAEAAIEEVLAEIYYQVGHFLAPSVKFYAIEELRAKGRSIDEIFEGPILRHGFIDGEELAASEFKSVVRASDIIQIIMDVAGVIAVKKIRLTNYSDGVPQTTGEEWCLSIGDGRALRLDATQSQIVFYKGLIPYNPDQSEVQERLAERLALDRHRRLAQEEYDLEVPSGRRRNIQRYYSLQHDFPLCYGIGREGLPRSAPPARKAQAKQFKAYLLFYDQMLANYFAQLAHVKDLFSLNPALRKTYFSQLLYQIPGVSESDVPGIPNLIKEFVDALELADHPARDIDDRATYETSWDQALTEFEDRFRAGVNLREDLLENQMTYEDRKNRLLDHLLARFGEKFTDYVLLMYALDRQKSPVDMIVDKLAFLKDYPVISHARGKAFDYKDESHLWLSTNVSGLEMRVNRLLGIKSFQRRSLSECIDDAFEIYLEQDEDGIDEYRFRLLDSDKNILLSSSKHFHTEQDARRTIQQVIRYGTTKERYQRQETVEGQFYFNLLDGEDQVIARRIEFFDTPEERDQAIDQIIDYIALRVDCEGFHLVEHILLRPQTLEDCPVESDCLLAVCVGEDCNSCSGLVDPYSFRVTAVVPYWPERFRNMDFRRFFEATLRQEAPAHVHIKICWVDQEAMGNFEEAYRNWLEENAKPKPDRIHRATLQNKLIAVLASLRSVYPETTLQDCVEGEERTPLLLDHSILGSTKKDQ